MVDHDFIAPSKHISPIDCYEFVRALPDPIIAISTTGMILQANAATTGTFGYDTNELVGRNVSLLMQAPDRDAHDRYLQRYLQEGTPRIIGSGRRVIARRKNGDTFPAFLSVVQQEVDNQLIFIGLLRDLTELKRREDDLSALGEIIECSLQEIYIFSRADFTLSYANQAALNNIGYTLAELGSLSPWDIGADIDKPSFLQRLEALNEAISESATMVVEHRRKDGSLYPVELLIQKGMYGGKPVFVAHGIDRTREAELTSEIDVIMRAAPVHILRLNAQHIVTFTNQVGTSVEGSSLVGLKYPNFPFIKNTDIAQRALDRCTRFQTSQHWEDSVEVNQETQWYSCVISPMIAHGEVLGYVVVAQNVTTTRNDQLQIQHHSRLAQIGELAAGIGHEINNPLAIAAGSIRALEKLLESDRFDPNLVRQKLKTITDANLRITNIVSGLRSFSRVDGPQLVPVPLNNTVSDTVALVAGMFSKEGIKVEFNALPKELSVMGSVGRIQQIVMNLLTNAQHAVKGARHPKVKITIQERGGGAAIIVEDNGRGMDQLTKERAFDAFFTSKPPGEGTGLGLTLSKSIAKELGGDITFHSEQGVGSTFEVYLETAEQTPPTTSEATNLLTDSEKSLSILIVDDDSDVRQILAEEINKLGIILTKEAGDGLEALEILRSDSFDLVITDLNMPRMGGIDFVRAIHALKLAHPPGIIVLTGAVANTFDLAERRELKQLIDVYLIKPFEHNALLHAITEANRKRKNPSDNKGDAEIRKAPHATDLMSAGLAFNTLFHKAIKDLDQQQIPSRLQLKALEDSATNLIEFAARLITKRF